jgi:uncharacterized membrane protein (DUF485 family)
MNKLLYFTILTIILLSYYTFIFLMIIFNAWSNNFTYITIASFGIWEKIGDLIAIILTIIYIIFYIRLIYKNRHIFK